MTAKWNSFTPEQRQAAERAFQVLDDFDRVKTALSIADTSVSFGDLYRFAQGEATGKAGAILQRLAADPALRADFERLLEQEARYRGPRLAAATSGEIAERRGSGFVIRIKPSSSTPGETYLLIDLLDQPEAAPKALFVRGRGGIGRHDLPTPRNGRMQLLLAEDSDLIRALRDVNSEVFLC